MLKGAIARRYAEAVMEIATADGPLIDRLLDPVLRNVSRSLRARFIDPNGRTLGHLPSAAPMRSAAGSQL